MSSLPDGWRLPGDSADAAPAGHLESLGSRPGALSVAALYEEVDAALATAFPRSRAVWVQGEVQSIHLQQRSGHCYIDLVDPESGDAAKAVLKVKCWRSTWGSISGELSRQGLHIDAGTVVAIRGRVDIYKPRGEIGFVVEELDIAALLGHLAMQRAALVERLRAEGLLDRNRSVGLPAVPLRVGLVASPGTEGCKDFMGQLEGSGFAFEVVHAHAQVQGQAAPSSVARALEALSGRGCDVVVVVRGGGSRGDLAAFDSEEVARAVATMGCQVWTGIGHTGDRSVTDMVAAKSFITPTECGQAVVRQVEAWWGGVLAAASGIAGAGARAVARAETSVATARARIASMARNQLGSAFARVELSASRIAAGAKRAVELSQQWLLGRAARLGPLAHARIDGVEERLASWRRLLLAYDVQRQLERGYTLTFDTSGGLLSSPDAAVAAGALVTRFATGEVRSAVVNEGHFGATSEQLGTVKEQIDRVKEET